MSILNRIETEAVFEPYQSGLMGYNGHLSTVWASFTGSTRQPPHQRMEVTTPDDDFIELDVTRRETGQPVLIILHGLEGSSTRYYVTELAMEAYHNNGWNIVAMNFRSCGSRLNRQPRFYHSGETSDLHLILEWIKEEFPGSPIFGAGFSLGGNVLLKSLGEKGENHPLTAAAAVSVPYDLEYGSYILSQGLNRVYEINFVQDLKAKVHRKRKEMYPDLPKFSGTRLYEFDNVITAPLHGFRDAADYYRSCSAKDFLNGIEKPVLAIHSKMDPLCPYAMVPEVTMRQHPTILPLITEYGGHVGFCSKPRGWVNRQILTFLNSHLEMC